MKYLLYLFLLLPGALAAQSEEIHVIEENYTNLDALFSQFRGKVIYIDFWASWCRPCLEEMPYSRKLQQQFEGEDLIFLYLAYRDREASWRSKMEALKMPGYHFFLDTRLTAEARQKFGITAIPHFAMIGKDGKIAYVQALPPSYDETANDLRKLLAE